MNVKRSIGKFHKNCVSPVNIYIALNTIFFFFWNLTNNKSPNWDEASYLIESDNLVNAFRNSLAEGFLYFQNGDNLGRPPFYAVLLTPIIKVNSNFEFWIVIFQTTIWIVWLCSIHSIAKRYLSVSSAFLVVSSASLHPLVFESATRILVDFPMTVGLFLATAHLLKAAESNSPRNYVYSGFILGLSFLTKPTALLFVALPWLFVMLKNNTSLIYFSKSSFRVITGFLLAASPWLTFNVPRLFGYFQIQQNLPVGYLVSAPDNAGTLPASLYYYYRIFAFQSWLWLIVVCGVIYLLVRYRELTLKKPHLFNFSIFSCLLLLSSLPLSFSRLWEFRYALPSITATTFLVGILLDRVNSRIFTYASALSIHLILVTLVIDPNPQNWSTRSQEFFYGSSLRLNATNTFMKAYTIGLEPKLNKNRAAKFLVDSQEIFSKGSTVGIPFSHPELNSITLKWEARKLSLPINFYDLYSKIILKNGQLEPLEINEIRKEIKCMDSIIIPTIPIKEPNYPDPTHWANTNIYLVSKSEFSALTSGFESYSTFPASTVLAVSSEQEINFSLKVRGGSSPGCSPIELPNNFSGGFQK